MLPAFVSVYPFSICPFLRYSGLSNINVFGPEVFLLFRDCPIIASKGDLVLNGVLSTNFI